MSDDIFARRTSIRKFTTDEVPPKTVQRLLEAALAAPSAGNCQPWHFYVVQSVPLKKQLARCAYGQAFIATAPLIIVVCAEAARSAQRYAERGQQLYCLQDTAAAIENILLCAAQNGLGACWCGAFDESAVGKAMHLPAERRPVAIIPIGHPKGTARKPVRRPMEEAVTFLD